MTKANSFINDIIIIWNIYECGHNLYFVFSLCLGCSQHVLCTWALVWTHAEKIFFQTYAQNGIIETYAHCVTGSPGLVTIGPLNLQRNSRSWTNRLLQGWIHEGWTDVQQWPHCAGSWVVVEGCFDCWLDFFVVGFPMEKKTHQRLISIVLLSQILAQAYAIQRWNVHQQKKHTYMHTPNDMYTLLPSPNQFCFNKKNTTHLQRNCHTIYTRNLQIALLVPNQKTHTHTHLNKINLSHPHSGQITKINSSAFFSKPFLVGGWTNPVETICTSQNGFIFPK